MSKMVKILFIFYFAFSFSQNGFATSTTYDFGDVDKYFTHTSENPSALPDKRIGNEIFYQLFVDRFHNGNRDNDCLHQRVDG
jgi:hypothetical protein